MGKADYALMAEYHRGYEDGKTARAADEWALQQKRIQAMNRVDDYITNGYPLDDSPFWLPTLPGVIHALLDTDTHCLGDLVDGLKELLGVDEAVRKPFVEYDALGNERHKAICELRKLADAIDDGQWVGMDGLADALGLGCWISNPVRKLLQLFAGDEYDSCVAIEENKSLRKKLSEPDTAEQIVRDLTLGSINESDAIARIEKLGSQHEQR